MGKKKSHKKEKRSRSKKRSSSESSSSRSRSRDRSSKSEVESKSSKETIQDLFAKSDTNYYVSQKSEMLMFDNFKDHEDKSTETFVWRKKNQKIGLDKLEPEKLLLLNKFKQEETARELEKLKRRKIEREREREEREREREFLQRQKETEYHKEWEKQEDSFHLKQVKLRSKIRIEEGRAKPIDLLAKYINTEDDGLAIEMHEPYTYLNGLTIRDLEDLLADIKVYSSLEQGVNADYWRDISIVTEDELQKLQKMDKHSQEHAGDRREGINHSVLQDVASLFKGKTYEQLVELENSIKKKIKEETGIDIEYWESLLAQLKAHMARARLRDRHQKVLYEKLERLKKEQGIENPKKKDSDDFDKRIQERISKEEERYKQKAIEREKSSREKRSRKDSMDSDFDEKELENQEKQAIKIDHLTICMDEYASGNYSPILLNQDDLTMDIVLMTQAEIDEKLEAKRNQVLGEGYVKPDAEEEFELKARETIGISESLISEMDQVDMSMGNGDLTTMTSSTLIDPKSSKSDKKSNTVEISVDHHYSWSDKYRPRKPRYYNRVHTGYDWNQYNKKHYDVDNPPPKTVQGYKFNIFYPDMIDKTKTPKYSITICQDNKDFAILRFQAGAPYEDVAFKIVNREWDISHKHGFRNQFQNGIYQLWFHFRKWKYRR